MNDRASLIILSPGFPASEADSNCLPMQQRFVRKLKELKPALRIVVIAFQYPYVKSKYQWHGIEVLSFDGRNRGGLKKLLLRKKVSETMKAIQITTPMLGLLSFWYGECAFVAEVFAKKFGLKHYCWLLGQDAREANKYPSKINIPPDRIVALSESLQEEFLLNHGSEPVQVIPPGVEHPNVKSPRPARTIDILGAGSLIPLKRFDRLIEIVKVLKIKGPDIKAVIAGDGPERSTLQKLIRETSLEKNVELAGEIPHDELQLLMRQSKIFIHPSGYEGFSGVCQEAIAGGAHVISFCEPMKKQIKQWHIVKDEQAMIGTASTLLHDQQLAFLPQAPYLIDDTAKSFLDLFGC